MHEFEWIAKHFAPLASKGSLGLKDDAALLDIPAEQKLVVTTDTLNEGVHFKAGTSPYKLAQKALRVNLSDLAAMGAEPLGYTLNLSLPQNTDEDFFVGFCAGLASDQVEYNITLLGGDTTKTLGGLSITITAYGLVDSALLRSGAMAGDSIYVTGKIGAGFLGLHNHSPETIAHYECPTPRVELGKMLREHASACMDISDGLVQDLGHLCAASGVGAKINITHIPLADESYDRIKQITGGDDYELLFTGADELASRLYGNDVAVTAIGRITEPTEINWLDENQTSVTIKHGGWQHF